MKKNNLQGIMTPYKNGKMNTQEYLKIIYTYYITLFSFLAYYWIFLIAFTCKTNRLKV